MTLKGLMEVVIANTKMEIISVRTGEILAEGITPSLHGVLEMEDYDAADLLDFPRINVAELQIKNNMLMAWIDDMNIGGMENR